MKNATKTDSRAFANKVQNIKLCQNKTEKLQGINIWGIKYTHKSPCMQLQQEHVHAVLLLLSAHNVGS